MIVPITYVYPQSRKVVIAGGEYEVNEVRVCDLVALQAFIDGRSTRPLEAIRGTLDGLDADKRGEALWGVYDALGADPPVWCNHAGWEIMNCPEGLRLLYATMLRQCDPGLTDDDIDWIADHATPEEFAAMHREWRRLDPVEEVSDMLDLPPDEDSGGESIPWTQAVAEVVELTGWTFDYISTLHMSQITLIRTGGKRKEVGVSVAPKTGALKDVVRFMKQRWAAWKGRSAKSGGD